MWRETREKKTLRRNTNLGKWGSRGRTRGWDESYRVYQFRRKYGNHATLRLCSSYRMWVCTDDCYCSEIHPRSNWHLSKNQKQDLLECFHPLCIPKHSQKLSFSWSRDCTHCWTYFSQSSRGRRGTIYKWHSCGFRRSFDYYNDLQHFPNSLLFRPQNTQKIVSRARSKTKIWLDVWDNRCLVSSKT